MCVFTTIRGFHLLTGPEYAQGRRTNDFIRNLENILKPCSVGCYREHDHQRAQQVLVDNRSSVSPLLLLLFAVRSSRLAGAKSSGRYIFDPLGQVAHRCLKPTPFKEPHQKIRQELYSLRG